MSKKNTFTASTKTITIGKGNLQFNTSTPEFRNKVQMFSDGINAMNDKRLFYADCVKTATRSLELYLQSPVHSSDVEEAKKAEIEGYRQAVSDITAKIRESMPTYDATDKALFYAYRSYINGEEDATSGNTYKRAFMEWLDNAGIVPTDKGISYIMDRIGVKKASARAMCKNGGTVFTAAMSEKQYLELVYRVIAEMMFKAKTLKPYKYEYVIPVKASK